MQAAHGRYEANRLDKQRREALRLAKETAYTLIPQVQLERCLTAQRGWTFIRHDVIKADIVFGLAGTHRQLRIHSDGTFTQS